MTNPLVHFLLPELGRWDTVSGDALALGFFQDERPLRGAAGIADWRLSGRISRLLKSGKIAGRHGETTMLPPAGARLSFPRLMLFGLGPSEHFDEQRYRSEVRRMRGVLHKAGFTRYAIQPPGRATGLIAARRALELWLEEAAKDGYGDEVTLIESQSGQKEMAETLRVRGQSG